MKIIAIGGGEIGRPGFSIETEQIDKEIIKLSGLKHPRLLFIPTASSDPEGYIKVVKEYFGKRLGCNVDVLYLLNKSLSKPDIKRKILGTDIIYVGGGNTLKMMRIWRRHGIDKLLKSASKRGTVLSGVSAGAVCWFKYANSDSRKFGNVRAPLIKVNCLNLLPALCCPHYDVEAERKASLKSMMKNTSGVAIALDNCTAIEIVDNQYKILISKATAKAYRVYWSKNKFFHENLPSDGIFRPLNELMRKP